MATQLTVAFQDKTGTAPQEKSFSITTVPNREYNTAVFLIHLAMASNEILPLVRSTVYAAVAFKYNDADGTSVVRSFTKAEMTSNLKAYSLASGG